MNSRSLQAAAVIALACVAVAIGYLMRASRTPPLATPAFPSPASEEAPPMLSSNSVPTTTPSPAADDPALAAIERIFDLLQRRAGTPADLAALKTALLTGDPAQSIAAIRRFLRSGRDAATGQEFTIAAGGTLSGAPTLRLTLLDALGQIARKARSDAASVVAREILAEKASADEWALALRNVGWTEPQSRVFLADKVRELLRYEPWRTTPSAGMLEALDVAVFTQDATLLPDLADARTAGNELAHAVDIALDRLAEAAPLNVLTYLNTHPALLNDRPFLRADYFAKADLAQAAQRAQIEIYLGRPDISVAEKGKLLSGLVTPASFVSDSLLTSPPVPDDGAARRAALTQTTSDWLSHNRFPALHDVLTELQQRLDR